MKSKSNNRHSVCYRCPKCKSERYFPEGLKNPPPCSCGGRYVRKGF